MIYLNPRNCKCKCHKSCGVGEYLDYKNCKCRNKLVDELVEKCSENIDGNEMLYNEALDIISLNDHKKVRNSGTIYRVLFAVFFITSICISSVFIHFQWYLKKIMFVLSLILSLKQLFIECNSIEHINGKY